MNGLKIRGVIFALFLGAALISAAGAEGTAGEGAEFLDQDRFAEEIYDFRSGGTWDYQGEIPAIVDFYAEWCGPCRLMAPILDELADEYRGRVRIIKIDVDENRQVSGAFGIQSVPSLLFIPEEGKPTMAVGYRDKEALREIIQELLL